MRKIFAVTLLIIGASLFGTSFWLWNHQNQEIAALIVHEPTTVTTMVVIESASAMAPSEGDIADETTTTTEQLVIKWVDYPSPERMLIEEIAVDVPTVITGGDRFNAKGKQNNPVKGTVDLWVSPKPFFTEDSVFVEPCEVGITFITAHTLSRSGVGYDFVDYEYVRNDQGLELGSQVVFFSESSLERISCTYEIFEWPEWIPFAKLADTPARFYPKSPAPGGVYINLVSQTMEPLLVLSTSYGGPSGREYQSNGVHKYYNAVLLGRLIDIRVENLSADEVE